MEQVHVFRLFPQRVERIDNNDYVIDARHEVGSVERPRRGTCESVAAIDEHGTQPMIVSR